MKSSRRFIATAAVAVVLYMSQAVRCTVAQTTDPAVADTNRPAASEPVKTNGAETNQQPFFDQTALFPPEVGAGNNQTGAENNRDRAGESGLVQFLEAVVSLGIVLVAICLLVWLFKKVLGRTPMLVDRRVGQVIGRMYLSPKNVIYLVHLADRVLVVGVSSSSMTCLSEIVDKSAVAAITAGGESFLDTLGRADKSMDTGENAVAPSARSGSPESIEEHMDDINSQIERLRALGKNESET